MYSHCRQYEFCSTFTALILSLQHNFLNNKITFLGKPILTVRVALAIIL